MAQSGYIIGTSFTQALQELRVNKLRTFLSLLGITIGIFCIVAVFTVLDSFEANIQNSMASLGSDVLYVSRRPWVPEGGEYKWWEYLQRRPMGFEELRALQERMPGLHGAALTHINNNETVKYNDQELTGITGHGVTEGYDKLQNIEIGSGRYLSAAELNGGVFAVVLGSNVAHDLFGSITPEGNDIHLLGQSFRVVGVLKKSGKNMMGITYDDNVIYPYNAIAMLTNTQSMDWGNDPQVLLQANKGINLEEFKDEATGILRSIRKVRPGGKNDFSINQLSQIQKKLGELFGVINLVGKFIGGFALIVGAFGVANIMFVTVRERTKIIGLKKAIGAKRSVIMTEFLIESITLCIIGGLVGIILVLLLSFILTHAIGFPITLSLTNFLYGIFISASIGTLAGLIPAFIASRLNPVVAIRST